MAMSKEFFSIIVWVLIITAGIVMLKVTGNNRVMIILAVIFFGGIIYLFQPILIIANSTYRLVRDRSCFAFVVWSVGLSQNAGIAEKRRYKTAAGCWQKSKLRMIR